MRKPLKALLVGGAVRDTLLQRQDPTITPGDRDWVVLGETPQSMLARGFKPVGRDFPVFLHPQTHEEYALARTERKTGQGYHGFTFYCDPSVTIEQDLLRRDLTINAMALDGKTLIDPFGGQKDLAQHCLRHVSQAFEEDPLRLFRLARFQARLGHFHVAPQTLALCQRMADSGEWKTLSNDRLIKEFTGILMAPSPMKGLALLDQLGLLAPTWGALPQGEEERLLLNAARQHLPLEARLMAVCQRPRYSQWAQLGAPKRWLTIAQLAPIWFEALPDQELAWAKAWLSTQALRHRDLLATMAWLLPAELAQRWTQAFARFSRIDTQSVITDGMSSQAIASAIAQARLEAATKTESPRK